MVDSEIFIIFSEKKISCCVILHYHNFRILNIQTLKISPKKKKLLDCRFYNYFFAIKTTFAKIKFELFMVFNLKQSNIKQLFFFLNSLRF